MAKAKKKERVMWLCLICFKSWPGTATEPPKILVKWNKEKLHGLCVDCAMWSE